MFFAPLAFHSYERALILWWAFSAAVYGICVYSLWRACSNLSHERTTVWVAAAGFPGFFHLIAWGQTSALVLACFTAMFFCLRERREFLAGLALGCLIFKPQLGLAAAILFLGMGRWKIAAGAATSTTAQLLIGVLYYGIEPFRLWLRESWNLGRLMPLLEPKPYQTHSLRTFWSMLVPWPRAALVLYLLCAAAVLYWTLACWKRADSSLKLRFSVLLFATVLVAPHLTVYDLVILAPAFLLLADWLIAMPATPLNRNLGTSLYFVYMLPLVGPLARWTHVQLSVIAMVLALYLISRLGHGAGSELRQESDFAALQG